MKQTVLSFACMALMLGCATENSPVTDNPSILDVYAYNMDGPYNVEVRIVNRNPVEETTETERIRVLITSYGPAVQFLDIPMLAMPNKLLTDLDYENPYDVNYAYFERTEIVGEITRAGGYFFTRFELFSGSSSTWSEREWYFSEFEPISRTSVSAASNAAPELALRTSPLAP